MTDENNDGYYQHPQWAPAVWKSQGEKASGPQGYSPL
jgi:hypothetical protein